MNGKRTNSNRSCPALTSFMLEGGSYLDICLCAGIRVTAFYNYVYNCIDAILSCEELRYSFPSNADGTEKAAAGFKACSTNGIIILAHS